jgi:hypothetical protein
MNPQMFGNLGMFNYGSLGDSPALATPMAAMDPSVLYGMGGPDPTHSGLINALNYISGLVAAPWQDNPRQTFGSYLSGDEPPTYLSAGGIRG